LELSGVIGDREARLLSELDHPGIVRFVTKGILPDGEPFLVMEWLDGESLSERLRRSLLTVGETLAVDRDPKTPRTPVVEPGCSAKAAWRTAVATGLDRDGRALVNYAQFAATEGEKPIWMVWEPHPSPAYFQVHGLSCKLLKAPGP